MKQTDEDLLADEKRLLEKTLAKFNSVFEPHMTPWQRFCAYVEDTKMRGGIPLGFEKWTEYQERLKAADNKGV